MHGSRCLSPHLLVCAQTLTGPSREHTPETWAWWKPTAASAGGTRGRGLLGVLFSRIFTSLINTLLTWHPDEEVPVSSNYGWAGCPEPVWVASARERSSMARGRLPGPVLSACSARRKQRSGSEAAQRRVLSPTRAGGSAQTQPKALRQCPRLDAFPTECDPSLDQGAPTFTFRSCL